MFISLQSKQYRHGKKKDRNQKKDVSAWITHLLFICAPLSSRPRREVCCENCENKNNSHLEINKRHHRDLLCSRCVQRTAPRGNQEFTQQQSSPTVSINTKTRSTELRQKKWDLIFVSIDVKEKVKRTSKTNIKEMKNETNISVLFF